MGKIIQIIHITPTKEMSLEVFKECYRFSMFAEIMHHPTPTSVEYDETITTIVAEGMDEVLYQMIQDDLLEMSLTIPKEFVDFDGEQLKIFAQ
jgi:hypothetical protein